MAPQPPASEGASEKAMTKGVRASTARTVARCTPMPPFILQWSMA